MILRTLMKQTLSSVKKGADYTNIPRARVGMELMTSLAPTFHEGAKYRSFQVRHVKAKWVDHPHSAKDKVLLYFHGGGYAAGSNETHKPLLTQIAKHAKMKGLIFEYRRSPEHKFPAPIEDSIIMYEHILEEGYKPEQIAFGGDSAGGGLAVATMLKLKELGIPLPKCYIGLSPWFDLTGSGESVLRNKHSDAMINIEALDHWVKNYLGDEDPKHPYASPLFGNLSGLPPIYLQVCESEVLLDDSLRFAEKAREAGVDVKIDVYGDLVHVWQAFWPVMKEGREANQRLGIYLREKMNT